MSHLKHVIIGGGAAGIFAAIQCKTQNPQAAVILLEKTNQLLAKVRISGGGRCNVTHHCFDPVELVKNYPRGSKELLGPFHTFQPKDMIAWLEERDVFLKTENDMRMFPTTDASETIIECLLNGASKAGVLIKKQQRISSIEKTENGFLIHLPEESILATTLLLATGSSSWGYEIARGWGHKIVDPVPSLFTFNTPTSPLLDLAGISVPKVSLSFKEISLKQEGPLLLTHWGFSGPAVLKLSAWAARKLHDLNYQATLRINWLAHPNQELLYQELLDKKGKFPQQSIPSFLPSNLQTALLRHLDIDGTTHLGNLSHKTIAQIVSKLCADSYKIEGKTTYKQEFVTAGGIDLKGVDFKTMQSRLVPHLFFAGEILNIDGVTGGFNFQNAWTTGWIAATAMGKIGSNAQL